MSNNNDLPAFITSTILTLGNNYSQGDDAVAETSDFSTTYFLETNMTDNSSVGNVTGGSPPHSSQPALAIQILARFRLIALPTIAVLGIISNILSFCIFISKTLRRTSCSIYLAARSVSDTGFLLALFLTWLGDAMDVPVVHTVVVCQLVVFSTYVFSFLSVWLVVFITLENYIRICHPFSVARFCTVQKARRVLLGLVIVSVIIYQFPLWTTHVVQHRGLQRCTNKLQLMHIFQVLIYADMVITLALPSVVIIFFMVAISVSLVRSLKRQSRLKGLKPTPTLNNHTLTTNTSSNSRGTSGQGQENGNKRSTKKKASCRKSSSPQAKVTRLLFAVSCTFLVLSLPSHIIRLRVLVMQRALNTPNLEQMLQVVFQILYHMSFAVNLLVYLCCGESFRNVFVETYVSCILGRSVSRRRSEISHTSYTAVKMETQEPAEKKEEETSLIS